MLLGVFLFFMKRFRISKNARWYFPGAGLGFVLVLLGFLQFRANRQLRDVLQQEMLTEAQTSLMRVRRGLEDVLAPICNVFAPAHLSPRDSNLQHYAAESLRVRGTATHPGLVTSIFVYQDANRPHPKLSQLANGQAKFHPADWPANLITLRDYLVKLAPALSPFHSSAVEEEAEEGGHVKPASFPWFVDENVPALVHPIEGADASVSFLIVQLDPNDLAENILPQLAEREFGSNGKLSYRVALVDLAERRTVIYSSEPGFGLRNDPVPDVQLNVFGPPGVSSGGAPSGDSAASTGAVPVSRAVREFQTEDSIDGSATAESRRQNRPLRIEPIRYGPNSKDKGWTLIALHRKGSVEAAVAALYRRNLTVDFGVLLVLTAMIATMVISVRRAHQLAQLRMDFVASVSHELRTPLTGIVSSAQNIADGLVTNKERAVQYGAAILGQAQQLAELVEEILLFSSTERGRIYNFQWLDVGKVIAASLAGTASQVQAARVRVEQHIEPDLPQVWGDFKALTQCLQNLIINATKYGGNARWIGIRASVTGMQNSASEVVIAVEDKGLGISPDELSRIFDPFYRSPAVTGEQIHGSGLGLSIVKSIAEAMGGKLIVQSDLGKGSTFSLHLPAEKKSPPEAASERAPAEVAGTR
jgi:signal transduction histidine kinase